MYPTQAIAVFPCSYLDPSLYRRLDSSGMDFTHDLCLGAVASLAAVEISWVSMNGRLWCEIFSISELLLQNIGDSNEVSTIPGWGLGVEQLL